MIKIISKLSLLAVLLLFSGCGGDNAFNGTGVIGSTASESQVEVLESLQKNVLSAHAEALLKNIVELKTIVNGYDSNLTDNDVQTMKESFVTIMNEVKSVEAFYVATDFDITMTQIKKINSFHTTKGLDVGADVQRALNENRDIRVALFKSSSKGISGLEYLLYGNNASNDELVHEMNKNNRRRIDAIKVSLEYLEGHASDIATFYANDTKFKADATDGANAVVNALIDSAFKTKEWRIGEAAGIAAKYKDLADPSRLEFRNSALSLEAIKAILETHDDVLGVRSYTNFGSFASENGAADVVNKIRTKINEALSLVNSMNTLESTIIKNRPVDGSVQKLYNTLKEIQELYFSSLIQALNLTAELIEADGD